jgi:hypothetical protein
MILVSHSSSQSLSSSSWKLKKRLCFSSKSATGSWYDGCIDQDFGDFRGGSGVGFHFGFAVGFVVGFVVGLVLGSGTDFGVKFVGFGAGFGVELVVGFGAWFGMEFVAGFGAGFGVRFVEGFGAGFFPLSDMMGMFAACYLEALVESMLV